MERDKVCGESLRIVDDSGCVAEEAVLRGGLLAFKKLRTDSATSNAGQPLQRSALSDPP
jgi:hypothetical protein